MIFDLNQITKHTFEDISEPVPRPLWETNAACRLTSEDRRGMPPDNTDIAKLRILLYGYYRERFGSCAMLEARCDIKRDTFQKVIRMQNGRSITWQFIAKFAVGARLSVEQAQELFELMGSPLDPQKKRYDYILLCELKNGATIEEYDKDLITLGYSSIFSKAD